MSTNDTDSPDDAVSLRVPRQAAVAIHYPGYIQNPEKALQTLGGEATLNKALQDGAAFLKLRLRPEDQHSHPLFGERQRQPGLVLRVSRPAGQPDADPTITIAARVQCSYTFDGLADYQYLGHDNHQASRDFSQLSARNQPAAADPFSAPPPLLLVPPIFSKIDMPVAFAFRDQAPTKESDMEASSSRKRIISFYERVLPPPLPLPGQQKQKQQQQQQQESSQQQQQQESSQQQQQQKAAADEAVVLQLQQLLSERPAWPLELLLEKIPGSTAEQLVPLLQALCYQFKTGPWKLLYLRCGFDPRISSESRQYQLVSYRLRGGWSKQVKAAKQSGQPLQQPLLSQLHSFAAMPVTHTTHLQLCDLAPHNQALRQLIEMAPLPVGPSEAYGWFTYSSSQQLHHAVNLAFQKTLQLLDQQQQQQQQPQEAEGGEAAAAAAEAGETMDVDQPPADAASAAEAAEPGQQQQPQQDKQATAMPAAATPPSRSPSRQRQQQQQQLGGQPQSLATAAAAAATAEDDATAAAAAVAAAAAGGDGDGDVVGLLGLGQAQDELQQWLQEAAAAAEVQGRAAAAAAAAGGAAAASGAESTDGGLSDSDWGTSAGETSAEEDTEIEDGYGDASDGGIM